MASSKLDQIVKGAPSTPVPSAIPSSGVQSSDPTLHLPSSPPQIYLNLLILEASLRAQYLELRARRRQHTFFLSVLALWTAYFGYALFLAPREDGSGVGGSVYWVVEMGEKVALGAGVVTGLLVWGTGQWERGVRWPRRWVGVTNRGLRGFNCKIVVVKGPWWKEWLSFLSFFLAGGLLHNNGSSTYRFIPPALASEQKSTSPSPLHRRSPQLPSIGEHPNGIEEDLSPGGDTISLLLLPKPFSPAFRENWHLYRTSYWETENERRRQLLKKLNAYEKAQRRKTAWWKRLFWPAVVKAEDVEKSGHKHGLSHSSSHTRGQHSKSGHLGVPSEKRLRSGSHSRTSSRSSTPAGRDEFDLPNAASDSRGHSRRSSTASNRSSVSSSSKRGANLTPTGSLRESGTGVSGRTRGGSMAAALDRAQRPQTPESDGGSAAGFAAKRRSYLNDSRKRESFISDASTESHRDEVKKDDAKRASNESLRASNETQRVKAEKESTESLRERVKKEQESSVASRVKANARETVDKVAEKVVKKEVNEEDVKAL